MSDKKDNTEQEFSHIEIRNLQKGDFPELLKLEEESYPELKEDRWKKKEVGRLIEKFPEGQLIILADHKIVGCALSIRIRESDFEEDHTYLEITDHFRFTTHDPEGELLYGIDVFIHPEFRGMRLGRRIYDARKELCENLNLKAIVFGGRIPGYREWADRITPREYIDKVKNKELYDPVLTFQLSNDFHVIRVLQGYMPGDKHSQEYATLLEWNNIYFRKNEKQLGDKKEVVRLGLVQWQMRPVNGLKGLFDQMEFFVDVVSGYKSDFTLFPEMFNAPLMAEYNHLPESDAIRKLAGFTARIRDKFREFALSYNTNIITGSMPFVEDGKLYNVGYLCHRNGDLDTFRKIHITPNEVNYWGMMGGNEIRTFDTDCGRVGIMICYDVEFPELSRLMAEEGMKILFVPFLTDTQNGYTRVRHCAQSRAIENECYVAIAGSVGNLPRVNNMDIQYAQSAVFTPSDFAFPNNGIKAEATPNTEMTLLVDVDLELLTELHNIGSVRTMKDRRLDLYSLSKK